MNVNHHPLALIRTINFVEEVQSSEGSIDEGMGMAPRSNEEELNVEFSSYRTRNQQGWAVAEEAQARHERMIKRLAAKELGVTIVDEQLDEVSLDEKLIAKMEKTTLKKEQASYFRKKLEDKAILLRDLSFKAEQMQMGKMTMDLEFVSMVIKLATKTKQWCDGRKGRAAPYSNRAINALYNEAVHTLVALGVFRTAFVRKEFNSEEECSFFTKKTQDDMVEIKSGGDWADELRTCFYESEDGCSHTAVRNSGD